MVRSFTIHIFYTVIQLFLNFIFGLYVCYLSLFNLNRYTGRYPEIEDSIRWLQNNQVPWELVLQHWRKTYNVRRENIEKSQENMLVDTFTKWPIFKHPNGCSLILEDFKCMALSEEVLTMEKWEAFFTSITSYIKDVNKKDDQLHVLMETLQEKILMTVKYILLNIDLVSKRNVNIEQACLS